MTDHAVTIRVWGDFACFTRPEMKVERVSYPVMTPSAARGILEAVFWEPQMYYLIDSIRVVKRGRWISFRRNEVTKVVSLDSALTWMKHPEKTSPIQAGGGARDAAQRNMLALQDVEYLVTAEIRVTSLADRAEDTIDKYVREFKRRANSGKCYHRPGLGMREFAADFEFEAGADPDAALLRRAAEIGSSPHAFNEDVGLMLYDVFDPNERGEGFRWLRDDEMAGSERTAGWKGKPVAPQACFFHARIENSRLDCHPKRVRILAPGRETRPTCS
jgi:CRISPR-associated protein Cas5d